MPAGGAYDPSLSYSPAIGLLYIFNLIVGTGALALPKAFQTAGWGLSIILLCISCLVSYVSATFVVESLSIANAAVTKKKRDEENDGEESSADVAPQAFEITQRVEVSEMASMFLSRAEIIFSYLALNIYLFGDLAIYSTTVSKSFMNVMCSSMNGSALDAHSPCREWLPVWVSRFAFYRFSVLLFIAACTPMIIIGITKTKYIQLATTISRWTAFTLMIILASAQLADKGAAAHPPAVNMHGFGSLFGVTVYAFMCHHSLPSLVTPMSSKHMVFSKMAGIYATVLAFYFTLSLTGSFAFERVQDVYTLNFLHDENASLFYFIIDHFLALFPVFTLSTNYPIVAITLMNNVKVLRDLVFPHQEAEDEERLVEVDPVPSNGGLNRSSRSRAHWSDVVIPIAMIGLPTLISLMSDDVLMLAMATGSYPGVGVQFVIPCLLVLRARAYARDTLQSPVPVKHASPFASIAWPITILGWALFSILMTTANLLKVQF